MEILSQIINQQTDMNIQPKDDEYIKDGRIYCKKCNTPRTSILNFAGVEKKVRCICKCQSEAYEHEQELERKKRKIEKIKQLKVKSLMGKRYEHATFESCKMTSASFEKAFIRCKKYCAAAEQCIKEGLGIYLYGDSGVGKTYLTACMCNALTNQLHQCLFTSFTEISKAIRATFNSRNETEESLIDKIVRVDVLFIDDLGTEILKRNGDDSWLQEKIYDIINKRYNNNKATIFSSNYTLDELENDRGMMKKTVDRILEMSNAIIRIEGESLRKKIIKDIPF